jgi:cytochrome c oxidase cbb3-type subunit III
MKRKSILLALGAVAGMICAACARAPGRPGPHAKVIAPDQITDFNILFAQNCAGCHGRGGKGGAAVSLSNPIFLAIAPDAAIRRTAANGVPGTPMPAFAQSAGGMLTGKQLDVIVSGIRSWAEPEMLRGDVLPPYTAETPGDPRHGAEVYTTFCSECHGPDGRGGTKAGSIVNGSYLALVSDQNLRTVTIIGLPDLGAPDWRGDVPGRPMSDSEISDVVAWLAAQRPQFPGQPFPNPSEQSATRSIP